MLVNIDRRMKDFKAENRLICVDQNREEKERVLRVLLLL